MEAHNSTNKHHYSHSQGQDQHGSNGALHSNSIFIVVIAVASLVLLIVLSLIVIILRRLRSTKNSAGWNGNSYIIKSTRNSFNGHNSSLNYSSSPDVKGGCLHGGNLGRALTATPQNRSRGVQVFTYKELEIATDRFSEANVVGHGGFGVVYRGVLSDGTVAAIKMLHRDVKHGERAFRIEVDLLSRLHSPNLMELLGYCADQNHRLLIFEFMPNGTLQNHLHPPSNHHYIPPRQPLDWGTRLRIALDCARALEFLQDHVVPSVIHRDFKCTNILLDQNFGAKVSDFGLAKMGSDKINGQISTRVLGTTGYLAPEYASTGRLTTKSDVYSYGVVLLELLTGRKPVDTKRPPVEHVLVSWALPRLTDREKLAEMVDPALKGQYSKKELVQVAAIAAVCVQAEADYRPLMTDIVQSLVPLAKNYSSTSTTSSMRFHNSAA